MNVSMAQVFKAVDYANSHPDKYLNGTTNWCAAVAFDLNRQANAAPQPPALGGEPEVVGYGFRNTMVGRSPVMMELRPDIPANDQYAGQLWYALITQDDHLTHLAPLQAEIAKLKVWAENYAELEKVFHSERDTWNRESAAEAKQSGEYRQEIDQLKARCDAMETVMKIMRTHEDMPNGYKYPVSLWFPAIDAALSKPAGSEQV